MVYRMVLFSITLSDSHYPKAPKKFGVACLNSELVKLRTSHFTRTHQEMR